MPKRYVLLLAEEDISEEGFREVAAELEQTYRGAKAIRVEGSPRAVILKTTGGVARRLRDGKEKALARGNALSPVLTSGAIVNLKRRLKGEEGKWRSS